MPIPDIDARASDFVCLSIKEKRLVTGGASPRSKANPGGWFPFFTFVEPHEDRATGTRRPHPLFARYNALEPDKRTSLFGRLAFPHRDESVFQNRNAFVLEGAEFEPHPQKMPACSSQDGITARRWVKCEPRREGDKVLTGKWIELPCPGKACQFCAAKWGKAKNVRLCKERSALAIVPVWPAGTTFPTPPVKFVSNSIVNAANWKEFIRRVEEDVLAQLPEAARSWEGIPVALTTRLHTDHASKTYPVVDLALAASPTDVIGDMIARKEKIKEMGLYLAGLPQNGLMSDAWNRPEIQAADARQLDGPASDYRPLVEDAVIG